MINKYKVKMISTIEYTIVVKATDKEDAFNHASGEILSYDTDDLKEYLLKEFFKNYEVVSIKKTNEEEVEEDGKKDEDQ